MRPIEKPENETKRFELEKLEGLYQAVLKLQYSQKAIIAKCENSKLLHNRLGHCSLEATKASLTNVARAIAKKVKPFLAFESCAIGISKRKLRAETNNMIMPCELLEKEFFDGTGP